jgi:hypothetical protein
MFKSLSYKTLSGTTLWSFICNFYLILSGFVLSSFVGESLYGGIPHCSSIYVSSQPVKTIYELQRLRLMTFNLENFILKTPSDQGSYPANRKKVEKIATIILEERPDILVLQEVHDKKSLQEFVRLFLSNQYHVEYIEGAEWVSHHIAFLIKKN